MLTQMVFPHSQTSQHCVGLQSSGNMLHPCLFNVECQIGAPQVAYREAIDKPATVEYTHKKQSGGSGQFAKVVVKFEPLDGEDEEKTGFIFDQEIKGGSVPKDYMGDVIGDINSRRGMVGELGERGNMKTVRAKVPLANMFQYVSSLRSATKGRASYAMELESYEVA